jgi:hypothetical protein
MKMNNHDAMISIERAQAVLDALIESDVDPKTTESNLFVIRSLLADTEKALSAPQDESKDDMSSILCAAADISGHLKQVAFLYQQNFSPDEVESQHFVMASLIAKFSHQLCKEIKAVKNLT